MSLESRVNALESAQYTKADTWKLDDTNSKVRHLREELEREVANRQSLEFRYGQLEERFNVVENALNVECPGCSQSAGASVAHLPPLCVATVKTRRQRLSAWWHAWMLSIDRRIAARKVAEKVARGERV